MGGRGSGKTRAGAEWINDLVTAGRASRIALVAPTLLDAREVMIEGVSGLRRIASDTNRPIYISSRRRLEWSNGAIAQVYSAEDPDSLRGPQFDTAWCDELAAWANGESVWDMLMLGLRLGTDPRVVATTTPRPIPLVKRLVADAQTVVTRSTTQDNQSNLSPVFLNAVTSLYGGTRLGRQELDGDLVEDLEGALWTRDRLEANRLSRMPDDMTRIIVAVDPAVTARASSDACGIVAAGKRGNGGLVVLADATVQGLAPLEWAMRAAALADKLGAAEIVAEANQGGELVREVLKMAGWTGAVRLMHARFSKMMRAAPVAALYEQDRVAHVGAFPALEDEMCAFGADGFAGSPDRVDALVWAIDVLRQGDGPRVRWL